MRTFATYVAAGLIRGSIMVAALYVIGLLRFG